MRFISIEEKSVSSSWGFGDGVLMHILLVKYYHPEEKSHPKIIIHTVTMCDDTALRLNIPVTMISARYLHCCDFSCDTCAASLQQSTIPLALVLFQNRFCTFGSIFNRGGFQNVVWISVGKDDDIPMHYRYIRESKASSRAKRQASAIARARTVAPRWWWR